MRTKRILFLSILLGFAILNTNARANDDIDTEVLRYRYNIAENTSDLFAIKRKFGKILKSGDISYSFNASKEVVEKLDKIGNDLDSIYVPEEMVHPYNVFLESVKAYRKSATCIRNATEIMLGYFDGTEKDVNQLIELSGEYVETANMYLDLSISLHSKFFKEYEIKPGEPHNEEKQKEEAEKPSTEFNSYISEKMSI